MEMSEHLTAHNTQDNATYSQPDSLASPFPWPASKEAKMITASSGLKLLELCEKCGHGGAFLKMFLGLSQWSSRIRYLNWKAKRIAYFQKTKKQAIPLTDELSGESLKTLSKRDMYYPARPMARQSFLLFHLSPSRPSIGEIGCGSLPTTRASKTSGKSGEGFRKNLHEVIQDMKSIEVPTPQAGDGKSGDLGRNRVNSGKQMNIITAIAEMREIEMPTPLASDGNKKGIQEEKRDNVPGAVFRMDKSSTNQQIRPIFYELLMGFPEGWCDLSENTPTKR